MPPRQLTWMVYLGMIIVRTICKTAWVNLSMTGLFQEPTAFFSLSATGIESSKVLLF
jgi:hypothetical protein